MSTTLPSRKDIAEWASRCCGQPITNLERQCASGVVYCQLLDAVRPGVVDSTKVKLSADTSQHETLANYRLLQQSLEKVGELQSIDAAQLARGQPQATLDLLHRIYALGNDTGSSSRLKRLSPLDVNSESAQASVKRARGVSGGLKRPTRAFIEAHNRLSLLPAADCAAQGDAAAAALPAAPAPAPSDTSSRSSVPTPHGTLQEALARAHESLRLSRAEVRGLMEERDFYYLKLAQIEEETACAPHVSSERLLQILRAAEGLENVEMAAPPAAGGAKPRRSGAFRWLGCSLSA